MISMLIGKVVDISGRFITVLVNGVGYKVATTNDSRDRIKDGQDIRLWIHTAIREDAQDLYGFLEKKDRDFFELLITVSGIGPKTALNILSLVDSDTLLNAIRSESSVNLIKVSGLGKKTADKIVLELKEKISSFAINGKMPVGSHNDADAMEALKALGYSANEAREALKKINKDIESTSEKVKAALKELV